MRRPNLLSAGAALFLVGAQLLSAFAAAQNMAPLSGSELREHCLAYVRAPQSAEGRSCAAYILGFIEGSQRVDVTEHTRDTRRETFSERALRTRLGVRLFPAPVSCLDRTTSLSDFIGHILAHFEEHPPGEDVRASAVMYVTLRQFYRCPVG